MLCCNKARRAAVAIVICLVALAVARAREPLPEPSGKPVSYASLEAACEASSQDQSPVLLIFSAEWCQPCQLLKKNTLEVPAFIEHVGALHLVDVDVDANQKVAGSFEVSAIPAMFLMTGDRKIIAHRTGYVEPAGLLEWIAEGRKRLARGEWEGTGPVSKFAEFQRKAAGDGLDASDTTKLAAMLDEPDPTDRAAVSRLLLAQREMAMPPLIDAVTNIYLGSRIAASELLHQLAPDAVVIDPWLPPAELQEGQKQLRKWWAATGKLPVAKASATTDVSVASAIQLALQNLRGDDTVKRTEAMAVLVNQGAVSLPALREAIRKCERTGDHRSLAFLEDVRWAILIPDSLEQQLGGVRAALARGNSPEQQAAAVRLGNAGSEAIAPLTELAASNDPLVVEKAVKALSSIGGDNAIPAMAALLKSDDSNLRMTAAQSLAHTKDSRVADQLISLLDDTNEVVVCTAVAGLEEVSEDNLSGRARSDKVSDALRHCLADTRWRVRAASAEAIGKLRMTVLAGDVKKLLDDSDGFVVKTALLALRAMSSQPDADQLAALARRQPTLRSDAVEMMIEHGGSDSSTAVLDIFVNSGPADQVKILGSIAHNLSDGENDNASVWDSLVERACSSKEVQVRREAVKALGACKRESAVQLVERLLADEDRETREGAAEMALRILANTGLGNGRRAFRYEGTVNYGSGNQKKGNKASVAKDKIAAWHALLLKYVDSRPDLKMTMAIYLTGDGKTGLTELATAVQQSKELPDWLAQGEVMRLLLDKLPRPESNTVLEGIARAPGLYTVAVAQSSRVSPEMKDYLLEPARFRAALEPASGTTLEMALRATMESSGNDNDGQKNWSLSQDDAKTKAIVSALIESTNDAWRAAAVFIVGRRIASENQSLLQAAVKDKNEWVRAAAVQGLTRAQERDRAALETQVGQALSDTNKHVAAMAALALLDPEVRNMANLEWSFDRFEFADTTIYMQGSFVTGNDDRPLTAYDTKPAFLDVVRQKVRSTDGESLGVFALLLAEYGDAEGLEKMILAPAVKSHGRSDSNAELLACIALIHDAKYIPNLRKLAQTEKHDYELRKFLQAIRGMSGPEARQFRLELNQQIRKSAGNASIE